MIKEVSIKKSVILDMLRKANPSIIVFTDKTREKEYTAGELIKEVENETSVGIAFALILEEMYNPKSSDTKIE